MKILGLRMPIAAGFALILALGVAHATQPSPMPQTGRATVKLQLKIIDPSGGISVDASKTIPSGTNGFDAVKGIVALKSKSFGGLGERISSLCDIDPPNGQYWAMFIDGKLSDVGISSVTISKNMLMEWKIQDQ